MDRARETDSSGERDTVHSDGAEGGWGSLRGIAETAFARAADAWRARHAKAPEKGRRVQPSAEIGRTAVQLLLRTISGDLRQPEVVTLPHQLIVRASTARAP